MKPHCTTTHASTTTPHRVSFLRQCIDFVLDVLRPPRISGQVPFKITRGSALQVANAPSHGRCLRGGVSTTRLPSSGSAADLPMRSPSRVSASGLPLRSPLGDGASCVCPVVWGSNASSCAAVAFSVPLAGSMLEVPLARAGANGRPWLCAGMAIGPASCRGCVLSPLRHWQDANVLTAPLTALRIHPRSGVTSPSTWWTTPQTPAPSPPLPHPLITPHVAADALVCFT